MIIRISVERKCKHTMKAINTLYKNRLFRSRLEARWAVFFDALGIEWEYEKEGYDLGVAGWYLPDFWLPTLGLFWEVKPKSGYTKGDANKYMHFTLPLAVAKGYPGGCDDYTVDIYGAPWVEEIDDYATWCSFSNGEGWIAQCPKCKRVDFVFCGWAGYIRDCHCWDEPCTAYKESGIKHKSFQNAVLLSTSARF